MENSTLTDAIYETIKNNKCVDIHDRKRILDYWVCVIAFVFDLKFKKTFEIVKANDYINILIDCFNYNDVEAKNKMEDIRNIINNYINDKIK